MFIVNTLSLCWLQSHEKILSVLQNMCPSPKSIARCPVCSWPSSAGKLSGSCLHCTVSKVHCKPIVSLIYSTLRKIMGLSQKSNAVHEHRAFLNWDYVFFQPTEGIGALESPFKSAFYASLASRSNAAFRDPVLNQWIIEYSLSFKSRTSMQLQNL